MARKPPWALQLRLQILLIITISIALAAGLTLPSDKTALLSFKSSLQADQASTRLYSLNQAAETKRSNAVRQFTSHAEEAL